MRSSSLLYGLSLSVIWLYDHLALMAERSGMRCPLVYRSMHYTHSTYLFQCLEVCARDVRQRWNNLVECQRQGLRPNAFTESQYSHLRNNNIMV